MTRFRAVVDVPATAMGPGIARAVVRAVLPAWDMAYLVENAELVVSELVTNAYRHSPDTAVLSVELTGRDRRLVIALADGSVIRPVVKDLDPAAPSGRGMALIQALCDGWGADERDGGKRVWVELVG